MFDFSVRTKKRDFHYVLNKKPPELSGYFSLNTYPIVE